MKRFALLLIIPLLLASVLLAFLRYAWTVIVHPAKATRIAIGFDQLANVAANGSEDETVSSRAARARRAGRTWGCLLCGVLDWLDQDHCNQAAGT